MTSTLCMKALCLAGRVILENGGETYRAEDTVLRMARALELKGPDVFAIPSGLFISFADENGVNHSSISRVHLSGTHLTRVNRVNEISRALTEGRLAPEQLLEELMLDKRDSPIFRHHIDYINQTRYSRPSSYEKTEPNQIIVDYIASMTDDYLLDLHRYLFPDSHYYVDYTGYFNDLYTLRGKMDGQITMD